VNHELQARVAREAAGLAPAVDADEDVVASGLEVLHGGDDKPSPLEIPAEAALTDYVAFALQRNPSIHRAVRALQALGYRVPQVASLEDPMLTLLPPTGDMTETAAGVMDAQLGLSQVIPFPGRLTRRSRISEQEVRMALATLGEVRIRTAANVARAYYEYYVASVSIDITRESETLLTQIRDVASARYRTGPARQADVLRAEVELYALTNDLITLEQKRLTARARLNSLLNRPVEAALPQPVPFELQVVDWKLEDALDRVSASNPQLQRLREQVKRDLEAIRLARLDYFPDLRIGFSYTFIGSGISPVSNGNDNWSLPLGINLPIWWQRLRAGVLEANARTLSSVAEFEEARNAIFLDLQDTIVKIDTQYRRAVLFRDLLIPRARQTVEVSTAAYQAGALDFTALIENWRNWFNFSLAYHDALATLEQRFADLQQLMGMSVPRRPPPRPLDAGAHDGMAASFAPSDGGDDR